MTMMTTGAPRSSAQMRAVQPKGRVLVADDELALLRTYQQVLVRSGYEVEGTTDGVDACARLAHESFDVVLSDVHMPGRTGIEVAQVAHLRDRATPVILVSGLPQEETATAAAEAGAMIYLHKPVDPRVLVQAVDHALHLHQAHQEVGPPPEIEAVPVYEADLGEVQLDADLTDLRVLAQPIVRASTRGLFGYDLTTVVGPDAAPLPFAAAARLGRLTELGRARRLALAEAIDRMPEGPRVVVQLHPDELLDAEIAAPNAPLSRHARRTILALTDRVPPGDAFVRLGKLRGMGFGLAIDDVATGGAGLSGIAEIAPDMVRVGPALVRGLDQHSSRRELVRLLRTFCKGACVRLVAMGVDRESERDLLVLLGCDLLQGERFAPRGEGLPAVTWW